jgi:hypothetical protein
MPCLKTIRLLDLRQDYSKQGEVLTPNNGNERWREGSESTSVSASGVEVVQIVRL